jgi:hypothetical protein
VLVVPGISADAEDPRIARLAACGKGSGVEPVIRGEAGSYSKASDVRSRRPASVRPCVTAKSPQQKLEHYRGVEYSLAMLDIDSKPFGAGCVGALTLALTYMAGFTAWALLGVPLLVTVTYYLAFQPPSPDKATAPSRRASVRAAEPFGRHGDAVLTHAVGRPYFRGRPLA